jgi:hypothetical protein
MKIGGIKHDTKYDPIEIEKQPSSILTMSAMNRKSVERHETGFGNSI